MLKPEPNAGAGAGYLSSSSGCDRVEHAVRGSRRQTLAPATSSIEPLPGGNFNPACL